MRYTYVKQQDATDCAAACPCYDMSALSKRNNDYKTQRHDGDGFKGNKFDWA